MLTSETTTCGKVITDQAFGSYYRVQQKCDTCGKLTETSISNYNHAQAKHSRNGETYCKQCATKEAGRKKVGKYSGWNKGHRKPQADVERKPYISSDGYWMVYRHNPDARNSWASYRKEHIVKVFEATGKMPEQVHHIDGDKLNNSLNNLWATTQKEHSKAHRGLTAIAYVLVRAGLIDFDRDTGKYVANVKLRELLEQPEVANQQPSSLGIG